MATVSLGGSLLVIASTVAGVADENAWLSALIAPIAGMLVVLMFYYLGSRHPGLTLLGILRRILGKWLGFIVSLAYVIVFLTTAAELPWYIGSFFGRMMHETPPVLINMFFIAGLVIAVLYGIESIARASELFIIVVTVLFSISIVMLFTRVDFDNMLPVLEDGIVPVLKGSYFLSCYITFSTVAIMMVFPRHTGEMQKAKKALLKGLLWSGAISFITILMTTLVLGSALTARSSFPLLLLASEIDFGTLLTRMEYIVAIIWLMTHFMVAVTFFYAAITSLSELIGLKNHKSIVLPVGLLVLVLSNFIYPNTLYQQEWDNMVYAPFITTFGFIIPLILTVVYFVKKRYFKVL